MNEQQQSETEKLLHKALECYLGAIATIQTHAVEISPAELLDYRARLGEMRRSLFANSSFPALEESRHTLGEVVAEYNAKITQLLLTSKAELKQILTLLREATETLSARSFYYDDRFRIFIAGLEKTAKCENLQEIRIELTRQVTQLRSCVEEMRADNQAAFGHLESQLKTTESKLEEAERLASTDPLTGLFNRREADRRAMDRVGRGIPFCFIIIDLNHFKGINDRFGHACGDQVLKLAAAKLREEVRPTDIVCRWGGDEFLVIMDCNISDALRRSQHFSQTLCGRFTLEANGRKVDIEVNASFGVAQYQPGESLEATFERADQMLYKVKQRR